MLNLTLCEHPALPPPTASGLLSSPTSARVSARLATTATVAGTATGELLAAVAAAAAAGAFCARCQQQEETQSKAPPDSPCRASKTSLNQLTKTMSLEVARRKHKVASILLHPGTVDTGAACTCKCWRVLLIAWASASSCRMCSKPLLSCPWQTCPSLSSATCLRSSCLAGSTRCARCWR